MENSISGYAVTALRSVYACYLYVLVLVDFFPAKVNANYDIFFDFRIDQYRDFFNCIMDKLELVGAVVAGIVVMNCLNRQECHEWNRGCLNQNFYPITGPLFG